LPFVIQSNSSKKKFYFKKHYKKQLHNKQPKPSSQHSSTGNLNPPQRSQPADSDGLRHATTISKPVHHNRRNYLTPYPQMHRSPDKSFNHGRQSYNSLINQTTRTTHQEVDAKPCLQFPSQND
jgi:hypothetical protein